CAPATRPAWTSTPTPACRCHEPPRLARRARARPRPRSNASLPAMTSPSIDALDVARDYMRAFNRGDRDAVLALYAPHATFDPPAPIWPDAAADAPPARAQVAWFFDTYDGAFDGGAFFEVRTIARIETGWTHVEWAARLRRRADDERVAYNGYF